MHDSRVRPPPRWEGCAHWNDSRRTHRAFVGVVGPGATPIDPEDTAVKLSQYRDEYGPAYNLLDDLSRGDVMAVEKVVEHTTQLSDALPATIITDESGMVLYSTAGVPSISDIKKLLQELEQ